MKIKVRYKKTLLAFLFLPLGLLAQSSYFQQATEIGQMSKIYNGTISVYLHEPVPSDPVAFNQLLAKIAKPILDKGADARAKKQMPTNVLVGPSPSPAPPAPGPLTVTPDAQTTQLSQTWSVPPLVYDSGDTLGLSNELLFILFLGKNKNPADYIAIKAPPERFIYLEEISSMRRAGAFNSSGGSTDFAFSESAIIYGITDFIIQRAKQQLVDVYLNKWQLLLENNCLTSKLLPQTIAVTRGFLDDNALNLAVFGDNFKAAYQEDFKNIPVTLQDESTDSVLLKCLGIYDFEATAAIAGGTRLTYDLFQKKHLVRIVEEMAGDYLAKDDLRKKPVFKKAVVLGNMVADVCGHMVTTTDKKDTYVTVSAEELKALDHQSWMTFFRLFFLRKRSSIEYIVSSPNISIDAARFINTKDEDIKLLLRYFNRTISILKQYQDQIASSSVKATQLSIADTRRVFDLSFQLMDNVNDYNTLFSSISDTSLYRQKAKAYFGYLAEIGEGVSTQQYGKLINGVVGIIATGSAGASTPTQAQAAIRLLQRYGSFMMNILSAQKSEQVQAALNELIPADNYQLKNKSNFTISLSAYPGVILGGERASVYPTDNAGVPSTALPKVGSWAFTPAPFLPIGIDFNFGHLNPGGKPARFNSVNLFLQALDLGAVLAYRVGGKASVGKDPDITFKQLLSPGFSLMTHFTNSPLVLGASFSYTPGLRTINQLGNVYASNAMRIGVFLAVDVTFFHLHSSNKTK